MLSRVPREWRLHAFNCEEPHQPGIHASVNGIAYHEIPVWAIPQGHPICSGHLRSPVCQESSSILRPLTSLGYHAGVFWSVADKCQRKRSARGRLGRLYPFPVPQEVWPQWYDFVNAQRCTFVSACRRGPELQVFTLTVKALILEFLFCPRQLALVISQREQHPWANR